ncbi:DMT family transporter [Candidatus Dependentiae bacterium]
MFLVILMYLLFASTFTIGKAVLSYSNPIFFIGFRMTLGGLLLLGYLYFFKRNKFFIKKKHLPLLLQITLFHIYIAYVFEFWALKYLSSFKTAFIYNLSPFISALFAYLFLKEKMSLRKWIGLVIGCFGFFLVLANGKSPGEIGKNAFLFLSWPEISLLVAVFSAVYGWVVFKKLTKIGGYSPFMINGFGMLSGGILAFATSFLLEGVHSFKTPSSSLILDISAFLGYALLLILIANVIGYNLYGHLLKRYSITFLSFAGFMCPLFAAFFGNIFLGEMPTLTFFISVIIVAIGLYIFYREELTLRQTSVVDRQDDQEGEVK